MWPVCLCMLPPNCHSSAQHKVHETNWDLLFMIYTGAGWHCNGCKAKNLRHSFFFCFFVKDNLRWSSKNRSTLVNKHSILWYFACNGRTLNWEFEIIWFNINEIFFLRYAYEFLMKMSRRFPSKTFRVCNVHVCCMGAWMFVILFKQHPLCNPMFPSWCWPVAIDTCGACAIQRCILDTGAKLTLYLNITYRSAAVYTCYVCTVCMMMGSTRLRSFYGS